MPVTFDHTIIPAGKRDEPARSFRELFELSEAPSWGPFTNMQLVEGVLLRSAELTGVDRIQIHHYAPRSMTTCSTGPAPVSGQVALSTGPIPG